MTERNADIRSHHVFSAGARTPVAKAGCGRARGVYCKLDAAWIIRLRDI